MPIGPRKRTDHLRLRTALIRRALPGCSSIRPRRRRHARHQGLMKYYIVPQPMSFRFREKGRYAVEGVDELLHPHRKTIFTTYKSAGTLLVIPLPVFRTAGARTILLAGRCRGDQDSSGAIHPTNRLPFHRPPWSKIRRYRPEGKGDFQLRKAISFPVLGLSGWSRR